MLKQKKEILPLINSDFIDGILIFSKQNNLYFINSPAAKFLKIKSKKALGKNISELEKARGFKDVAVFLKQKNIKEYEKEIEINENLILKAHIIPLGKKCQEKTLVVLHNITRAKRVDIMKTDFISLAAHQLRTPISTIKWTLRMLVDEDFGEITRTQRKFMERIYKTNEKTIKIIDDLLNMVHIEQGTYLSKKKTIDIEKLFKNSFNFFKKDIKKKGIEFEIRTQKNLPKIKADQEKIQMAINNIFENAVKYTLEKGKIIVSLKHDKKEIKVCVRDTGVGIPFNQQYRVFSKFFRGARAITIDTEGTGLGLFIARNIIEAHNGRIWFKSQQGKGSEFYFTLPIFQN
ncbi:MAG: ATP-binding protein [Patescibacteria group bacterium]|nr:ATP-binding protein [Patescibacteria group bacterium]